MHREPSRTTNAASISVALKCQEARELERRGEYAEARACMAGIFPDRIGDEPKADGLSHDVRAEVYLRCGSLMNYYASSQGIAEGPREARRLLEYAYSLFEALENRDKEAETLNALAVTFWKEGNLSEAHKDSMRAALRANANEPKALALIHQAIACDGIQPDYGRMLFLLSQAAPFVDEGNHFVAGIYYNTLAIAHQSIGETKHQPEHFQIAIIHSTGACFHFEKLGHRRFYVRAENVLGNLYRSTFQYEEAREHLQHALRGAELLKDVTLTGQIYDTLAQTLRDQHNFDEAEKAARNAIRLLEDSGERIPLAEAYRTLSSILDQREFDWSAFSLNDWLLNKEREWIARAARESNGITRTAEKLGVKVTALRNRIDRTFPELNEVLKQK
jgi:tetratricopeptide (TPR) repeat protein